MKKTNVLVIGSGGREHAFIHGLKDDEQINRLYCAPGNGGTAASAENVALDIMNNQAVLDFAGQHDIDFTIVGPEAPLANGLVDVFEAAGKCILGPTKYAAQLESSKIFAREMMAEYHIPHPEFRSCATAEECWAAVREIGLPVVLKADGLAAGKGVLICRTDGEIHHGIQRLFEDREFGAAGDRVSVEKCLVGEELSVFALCDGDHYVILNSAQDHKRAFENDAGPNTGGMGAYSPTPLSTPELLERTGKEIIAPTLQAMKDRGHPYRGFLYAGLMLMDGDPYVIEFNVRMGDPETQVVLPLLKSSLFDVLYKSANGKLGLVKPEISNETAVTVVLASDGYPGSYEKGKEITGLDACGDALVYHAGTKMEDGKIVTSGGRVLNVVGFGADLPSAVKDAYRIAEMIQFDGKFLRRDIGARGLKYLDK